MQIIIQISEHLEGNVALSNISITRQMPSRNWPSFFERLREKTQN